MVRNPGVVAATATRLLLAAGGLALCLAGTAFADSKSFTGTASTDWFNANNWNPTGVPAATDDVTIASGKTADVSSSNTTVNKLTLAGTLTGTATLTVNGLLTWTAGKMAGSGVTNANGGMDLSGSAKTLDGRTLNNAGATVLSGASSSLILGNGAVFTNLASGSVEIQNDASINGFGSPSTSFANAGTLTRTVSSGIATIAVPFNNGGTVDVQTGTLSLTGGGNHSGSFDATGATLRFGGGTHTLGASASVTGGVAITGGSVNVGGSYAATATTLAGGTLNFTGAGGATSGSWLQSGGMLTGSTPLTVSGLLTWTSGTMNGNGVTNANGGMDLSGSAKTLDTRALNNAGAAVLSGASATLIFGNAAVFTNLASGSVDIQNDATLGTFGNPAPSLVNAGIFKRTVSSGVASVNVSFSNSGMVDVQTGTLSLNGGGTSGGSFDATGATLRFGGGAHTLGSTASITATNAAFGAGSVNVAGSLTVTGSTTVTGGTATFTGMVKSVGHGLSISGGTANFSSGEPITPDVLSVSGGTLTGSDMVTVSGQVTWTSGTMSGSGVTNANGGMDLSGSAKTLDGRTLNNAGAAVLSGASSSLILGNGAVFTNLASGSVDIQNDPSINSFGNPASSFVNAGMLTRTVSSGTATITVPFNNNGMADVQTGTLSLNGGGTHGGGFDATGATLRFGGGTHTLSASSSVTGTVAIAGGTVNVGGSYAAVATTLAAGTVNLTGAGGATSGSWSQSGGTLTGSASLTVSGLLTWTSGTMNGNGVTNANGGMDLSGAGKTLDTRTLTNLGAAVLSGPSATLTLGDGAVFDNLGSGSVDIQNDATLNTFGSPASNFINAGTLTRTVSGGTATINIPFTNSGTLNVAAGTLAFNAPFTQNLGVTRLGGGALRSSMLVNILGGSLEGSGTVTGNVSNAGALKPGLSPGLFSIAGAYTQSANGTLDIEIGGLAAGTDFDKLAISGAASLAGTLNVSIVNGFVPAPGNSFQIMAFASHIGDFTTNNGLVTGIGLGFNKTVSATDVTLTFGQENCSDGIDNDGDGHVDCADAKCVNFLACGFTPTVTATTTPTPTPSRTPSLTATSAASPTPTLTFTPADTPTVTPTRGPFCTGDCNDNNEVTVDELLTLVSIALGNVDLGDCRNGDVNDDKQITVDEILAAVSNALNGCTRGPVPTATVPASGGNDSTIAGAATIVTNAMGVIPNVVGAIASGLTAGSASAVAQADAGGAAGMCPDGGSASRVGSFPFVSITLAACKAFTASGAVTYSGTIAINLTSLSVNLQAVFEDAGGALVTSDSAVFSGTVSATLGGACAVKAVGVTITNGSVQATKLPDGTQVGVSFQGTTMAVNSITFNGSCLPVAYLMTFDGPAALLSAGATPVGVTFQALSMDVDRSSDPATFVLNGGMQSSCFGVPGMDMVTLTTAPALAVPSGEICPHNGTINLSSGQQMANIFYRSDGSVDLDDNGDGIADRHFKTCLDSRLLMCVTG